MTLLQIVYVSAVRSTFEKLDLVRLAEEAALKNAEQDVTGLLLHHDGSFIQALEGPPPAVRSLMRKIRADERHSNVMVLLEEEVEEREFGNWGMCLIDPRTITHELEVALEPLLAPSVCLEDALLNRGRAHRLIQSFVRVAH